MLKASANTGIISAPWRDSAPAFSTRAYVERRGLYVYSCTYSTGRDFIFCPQIGGGSEKRSVADEELSDVFYDVGVKLARDNLEVTLRRTKEQCFRAVKECASESLEGFKNSGLHTISGRLSDLWDVVAGRFCAPACLFIQADTPCFAARLNSRVGRLH